jgi:hypothetical protein
MAVDPARAEETIAWLAKADEDLRAARVLIDVWEPLLETASSTAGRRPASRLPDAVYAVATW